MSALVRRTVFIAILFLLAAQIVLRIYQNQVNGQQWRQLDLSAIVETPVEEQSSDVSKIGKVLMQYGNLSSIYERGLATHDPHNERFGYRMSILRTQTLPHYWSKPAYILKLLLQELEKPESERLQWLFWFDGDIVLMNPKIPLEIFLPPRDKWSHIHAIVSQDHKGLNNGVFGLRVHEWSVWLMSATLSISTLLPSVPLRFGDQSALEYWVQSDTFRNSIMHVPQRWFNAYAGFRGTGDFSDPGLPQTKWRHNSVKEGDLLVHHAGNPKTRPIKMEPWLKIAEQHLSKWEVELSNTSYPDEIRRFWEKDALREWQRVEGFRKKSQYQY